MMTRPALAAVSTALGLALLAGCADTGKSPALDGQVSSQSPESSASTGPASTGSTSSGSTEPLVAAAISALPLLPVKGRAPKTGYERSLFGQAWSDDVSVEFGRNGCDTRNDILQRDLQEITFKPGSRDCVVLSGVLEDPYSGERIEFVRGQGTSNAVQVDHVVALADAWQKGAQQLPADQLRDLANDPLNLQAVSGPVNQQKGASDTATWLPPRREYRCQYVARQVLVKERYGLWVTAAEREAMERVLSSCG